MSTDGTIQKALLAYFNFRRGYAQQVVHPAVVDSRLTSVSSAHCSVLDLWLPCCASGGPGAIKPNKLMQDPVVAKLAEETKKSPAQVGRRRRGDTFSCPNEAEIRTRCLPLNSPVFLACPASTHLDDKTLMRFSCRFLQSGQSKEVYQLSQSPPTMIESRPRTRASSTGA